MAEFGGNAAMRKLGARQSIGQRYTDLMKDAGDKMQAIFKENIAGAKTGFVIALAMDLALFLVGIALIVLAAVTGVLHYSTGGAVSWEGTGISGGAGVLAVTYTTFVSKPRFQVKGEMRVGSMIIFAWLNNLSMSVFIL